jgi:hypothetical protein
VLDRRAENPARMRIETFRGVLTGRWLVVQHLAPAASRRRRRSHLDLRGSDLTSAASACSRTGRVELLINFGEPYRILDGRGADHCRVAWLGGPQVGRCWCINPCGRT